MIICTLSVGNITSNYLYSMRNKTKTVHHLLAKSRNGSNDRENRVWLRETFHRAFHTVFQNDTPPEQIIRILELNESVFQGDFLNDIMKVLDLYKEDVYHSNIKKVRKRVKRKASSV